MFFPFAVFLLFKIEKSFICRFPFKIFDFLLYTSLGDLYILIPPSVIFCLPFLELNDVICDYKQQTCIVNDKNLNYNLLHLAVQQEEAPKQLRLQDQLLKNKFLKKQTSTC